MESLLGQCHWPELPEPNLGALHQAVVYLLARYETVLGILVSGTILRGQADRSSDLDIYLVQAKPERQRLQKFFNGVPAEIFVNPVKKIEAYFQEEQAEGRPISAHMWATGFVVLELDPVILRLRHLALESIKGHPTPNPESQVYWRYLAATSYEDALDVVDRDPASAIMLLNPAITSMLQYTFLKHNLFIPRQKDLFERLSEIEPRLSNLAREFYLPGDLPRQMALAQEIADLTIEARGFFEWESNPEPVE